MERRIHFTTFAVVLAIQVTGVLVNVGGHGSDVYVETVHGWPMQFGVSDLTGSVVEYNDWRYWWQVDRLKESRVLPLLVNAGLWLTVSITAGLSDLEMGLLTELDRRCELYITSGIKRLD